MTDSVVTDSSYNCGFGYASLRSKKIGNYSGFIMYTQPFYMPHMLVIFHVSPRPKPKTMNPMKFRPPAVHVTFDSMSSGLLQTVGQGPPYGIGHSKD